MDFKDIFVWKMYICKSGRDIWFSVIFHYYLPFDNFLYSLDTEFSLFYKQNIFRCQSSYMSWLVKSLPGYKYPDYWYLEILLLFYQSFPNIQLEGNLQLCHEI